MRVSGRPAGAATLAVALAAAALAGCGSDAAGGTTTATPTPPNGAPNLTDRQQGQFEKLRACLKKQGAELPEPGGHAGSAPPQIDQAAIQACSRYAPSGGPPGGGPPGGGPPGAGGAVPGSTS
jgi:hypothetical protein